MSRRSFAQRVPQNTFQRPREGDLVYIPFLNGTGELYEITFADQDKEFHTLGRTVPYFYELRLEKFKYSNEIISTGVAPIDDTVTFSSYTLSLTMGAAANTNNYNIKELVYQAPDNTHANATATAMVQSWLPLANTLTISNIAGEFVDGHLIVGASSNARHMLVSFNPLKDSTRNETYDNLYIENQANNITDFSEVNPFGKI